MIFENNVSVEPEPDKPVDLTINGAARRSAFFVKIFFAALYVETPTTDGQAIIDSGEVKLLYTHTLRNISRRLLVDKWTSEFERLCDDRCEELLPYHEKFLSFARGLKKGERGLTIFYSDRVEFVDEDKGPAGTVESPEYGRLFLRSVIGAKPDHKKFKRGLLGLDTKTCPAI